MRSSVWLSLVSLALATFTTPGVRAATCSDPGSEVFQGCLRMAQDGNIGAAEVVAERYANGDGTPRNADEAMTWFRKAGEAGYPSAIQRLALEYVVGGGLVARDDAQALYWAKKGAEQNLFLADRI